MGKQGGPRAMIVPYDGSEHSDDALKFAIRIAEKMEFKIVLVNVQPNIQTANVQRFFSKEEVENYSKERGIEVLAQTDAMTEKTLAPVEKAIRIGNAQTEICKLAKELDAYCIIMGSRGRSPLKGAVLGSVSYGVLHNAPCPVTIVP
ncbi:nucleotide-binding universal stress UspA family protein [Cerasibacillus quisquiliarum]|uniref:Universal stress protein UspA n=1 Tax=Cerasibacillus quisquiliarum TaxID=227865 RepID=A0A511V0F6_9BACI|nr:universal stress protein [Cerasibacillus quisquiliarum]MBB5147462.1 nucleotide-binding universal stress UspA family protein [Cerasibacillus quisquiliarum]GEN32397.1 universal stress protein UspA [Cerasibacillus quisquiliarum]